MKIYTINGYCPHYEDGEIHLVNRVFANQRDAEAALNEYMDETRQYACEAEKVKGLGSGKGTWTESVEQLHGEVCILQRYECRMSVDLEDEDGFQLFKTMSVVGLFEANGSLNIANGINVDHLYSATSFKVTKLELQVKDI